MIEITEPMRRILKCRSRKDKIALAINCEVAPVGDLPIISRLVREGYLTWIDRATLPIGIVIGHELIQRQTACDIYELTPKGVELCDANGIKQR